VEGEIYLLRKFNLNGKPCCCFCYWLWNHCHLFVVFFFFRAAAIDDRQSSSSRLSIVLNWKWVHRQGVHVVPMLFPRLISFFTDIAASTKSSMCQVTKCGSTKHSKRFNCYHPTQL
jgi:hypothetical protein